MTSDVCALALGVCAEDGLLESVVSFHHVSSGMATQVIRLGVKGLTR